MVILRMISYVMAIGQTLGYKALGEIGSVLNLARLMLR